MADIRPVVGSDRDTWGSKLLTWLGGSVDVDGSLKAASVRTALGGSIPVVVTAYGTVGDGVTDDTAAIQAAINAASAAANSAESGGAGRGVVYIPPGSYAVTNLTLKSDVTIYGAHFRTTTLIATGSSGYVFGTTGISHGTRMANVRIQGLTIAPVSQQSGLNVTRPACGGIDLSYSTWCSLRDVFIHNLAGTGILCTETYDLFAENVQISWTGTNGSSPAIWLVEGTGDNANATHWIGCRVEQCPVMLRLSGSTYTAFDNQFVGCKFEWHTNGTLTHDGAGIRLEAARQLTFDACSFVSDDNTYPVIEIGAGSLTCYGVKFDGCDWLAPSAYQGWALNANTNTGDLQINGGHISLFAKGFVTSNTATAPQFTGLTAYDCQAPVIDTVRASLVNCRLQHITQSVETPAVKLSTNSRMIGCYIQGSGVFTDGVSASDNCRIVFNRFETLVAGVILNGVNASVRNNTFSSVTTSYSGTGYPDATLIEDAGGTAIAPNSVATAQKYSTRLSATSLGVLAMQHHDGTNWLTEGIVGQAVGTLLRSGLYYLTQPTSSNGTSVALGNGTLRLTPFWVPRRVTLTRIGAEVTVIGDVASTIRLGIYNDDGTGYPGALVLDAGTIAGDSATTQEITISQALEPGLYWIGGAVQGAAGTQPTCRTFGSNPVVATGFSAIPSGGGTSQGYSMTGVTGALGAFSSTVTSSGLGLRTFVKIA